MAGLSGRSILRRFLGMNPLRRGRVGISVYAGLNLGFRKRCWQGIDVSQPFAGPIGSPDRVRTPGIIQAGPVQAEAAE